MQESGSDFVGVDCNEEVVSLRYEDLNKQRVLCNMAIRALPGKSTYVQVRVRVRK